MPRTYTPAIRFATNQSGALKSMVQRAEPTIQVPSDHVTTYKHFSGVVRKQRDWRGGLVSYMFSPVPAVATPATVDPLLEKRVELTGANFAPGCQVQLDGLPMSDVVYTDENHISFMTPRITAFEEDLEVVVTVIRPDKMTGSNDHIFKFEKSPIAVNPPIPSVGYVQGDEAITIFGNYFKVGSRVTFTSPFTAQEFESDSVVWLNKNSVEAVTPFVSSTGTFKVKVISPSDLFSNDVDFNFVYKPPVINSFDRSSVSPDFKRLVTMTGSFFLQDAIVVEELNPGADPTWDGSSWLTASTNWYPLTSSVLSVESITPGYAFSSSYIAFSSSLESPFDGVRNIAVLNADGKMSNLKTLTYLTLPEITVIDPIYFTGGVILSVTGAHLSASTAPYQITEVRICSASNPSSYTTAVFSCLTPTTMQVTSPSLALGDYYLQVLNGNGTGSSAPDIVLTYTNNPVITSVVPSTGGLAGGFDVTITGIGFSSTAKALVNTTASVPLTYVSPTKVNVTMPAVASAGIATITIYNFDNISYSDTTDFMYESAVSIVSGTLFFPSRGA